MTRFTAKIRKIGNSVGIYLPRSVVGSLGVGDVITLERPDVITNVITGNVITRKERNVITSEKSDLRESPQIHPEPIAEIPRKKRKTPRWCDKHEGWNISCGCE